MVRRRLVGNQLKFGYRYENNFTSGSVEGEEILKVRALIRGEMTRGLTKS